MIKGGHKESLVEFVYYGEVLGFFDVNKIFRHNNGWNDYLGSPML